MSGNGSGDAYEVAAEALDTARAADTRSRNAENYAREGFSQCYGKLGEIAGSLGRLETKVDEGFRRHDRELADQRGELESVPELLTSPDALRKPLEAIEGQKALEREKERRKLLREIAVGVIAAAGGAGLVEFCHHVLHML